mgnify:CR=1 FL=1
MRHEKRWEDALDVRDAVAQYWAENGYPPSVRDVQRALKLSSSSVAALHIDWAVRFGLVQRDRDIARSLREIRKLKHLTIVVSEQVLSFALDVADRVHVMETGRITLSGSADEMRHDPRVEAAYLGFRA